MKQLPIVLIVLAILGVGGYMAMNKPSTSMPTEKTTPAVEVSPKAAEDKTTKQITLEEIAKHGTKEDCWFAIDGNVYDVTAFIASQKHKGGDAIISGCGKDTSDTFNMRPKDGKPHSDMARSFLPNFQIGVLAK
jgi:cytochrome b involved in lipid metabolism